MGQLDQPPQGLQSWVGGSNTIASHTYIAGGIRGITIILTKHEKHNPIKARPCNPNPKRKKATFVYPNVTLKP
jgi:hypothetical protein